MGRVRVMALRDGEPAALFEEGQLPTYHGGDAGGDAARAAVAGHLLNGLPLDGALARLLATGFTLVCRRGG